MKTKTFPLNANDFLVSTIGLSCEQAGAFIRLLCLQWNNGHIPADIDTCQRIVGWQNQPGFADVLQRFAPCPVGLRNAQLEEIRVSKQKYAENQANKAKVAWETRPEKPAKASPEKVMPKAKASSEREVQEYCVEIGLRESDGAFFWNKWLSCDWTNNKQKIKDWKATIRSWKAAGYVPSQRSNRVNGWSPEQPRKSWEDMTEEEIMREVKG